MEYSSSSLVFSSFWTVCDYPKLKQQHRLCFRKRLALFEQKKTDSGFGEKPVRFFLNGFGCGKISHRLWENQRPISGKSATDFGKMSHRLSENEPPTFGK